jgi:hypothetical protein
MSETFYLVFLCVNFKSEGVSDFLPCFVVIVDSLKMSDFLPCFVVMFDSLKMSMSESFFLVFCYFG